MKKQFLTLTTVQTASIPGPATILVPPEGGVLKDRPYPYFWSITVTLALAQVNCGGKRNESV
jgi:hypothetical protein